jgi:flagellar motor switch protein FliG
MTGDDKVALLLGTLPHPVVEAILAFMNPGEATRIRARLSSPPTAPADELRQVAREFADLLRIDERPAPPPPAPVSAISTAPRSGLSAPTSAGPAEEPEQAQQPPDDPVTALRNCTPEALAGVLAEERASTVSLVLGYLDVPHASAVLKLLPAEVRHEAVTRQHLPVSLNEELVGRILRLVLARCRETAEKRARPSGEGLIARLCELVRSLEGPDRRVVLERLERTDAPTAEKVRKQLYRFADLVRLDDRALQGILGEVDVKTLALALKGGDEDLKARLLRNVSKRAQQNLTEEMEMLGSVPPNRIEEAQEVFVLVLRRLDEEGKLAW